MLSSIVVSDDILNGIDDTDKNTINKYLPEISSTIKSGMG